MRARAMRVTIPSTPNGHPSRLKMADSGFGLSLLVPNVQPFSTDQSTLPTLTPTTPTTTPVASDTSSSSTASTTSSFTPSEPIPAPTGGTGTPGTKVVIDGREVTVPTVDPTVWVTTPGKPFEYWDPALFKPGGALASVATGPGVVTNQQPSQGATVSYQQTGTTPDAPTGSTPSSATPTQTVSTSVMGPTGIWDSGTDTSTTSTASLGKTPWLWVGLGVVVLLALGGKKR